MAQEIDWLSSRAGMCKINLYNPHTQKDHDRKVICFLDVANANLKDRKLGPDGSTNITDPASELDLTNLEEKEVIVIKDNEQKHYLNTEGAVCLLKQGFHDDRNVVSWLSNDLQKYAVGFQHALTPLGTPHKEHVFDKVSQNNNNTAPNSSSNEKGTSDDLAYYANKLCSLVVEMTRKEIKEQWESSGKCIRHIISPHSSGGKATPTEGGGTKTPVERSAKEDDPFSSDTVHQNVFKQQERVRADKAKKADDVTSISKGMMVYANQVASDMMLSFLKTLKVQKGRHPQPACAVLKEVLVRHTKEIVSDLIDSSMKNLHNITGALMTDSDFVCGLKKNLYNVGAQKTAEVLDVMVKRLFKLLSGDDKQARSQSLAFTSYKTAGTSNQRAQGMQFASLKSESRGQEKHRTSMSGKTLPTGSRKQDKQSMELYAKELLLTALMQIQQHLLDRTKDPGFCDTNSSSYGYGHWDPSYDRAGGSHAPWYDSGADFYPSDSLKEKGNLILSMVQKILHDAGLNLDEGCGNKNRG